MAEACADCHLLDDVESGGVIFDVETNNRAVEDVRDEDLRMAVVPIIAVAPIIDGHAPGTIDKDWVGQSGDELTLPVDNHQRARLNRILSSIFGGQSPNDHKAIRQDSKGAR